jgi:Leucine-rich repeat (LRR) protein
MMIYLHGNNIFSIQEVEKLVPLHKLKSLTLHGNPVEASPGYRFYILSTLPQLQTFDFSGVTKEERQSADCWKKLSGKKKVDKQLEDLDF